VIAVSGVLREEHAVAASDKHRTSNSGKREFMIDSTNCPQT